MVIDERQSSSEQQGPAVLLIDDNAIQAATRQAILRRAGYLAIAALNPGRALEQFEKSEFPAEIQAVITDHVMPGMNGAEFVHKLREIRPDLPVIVISGLEEAESLYEGMNVLFLLKPLPPEQLIAHLTRTLSNQSRGAA
jgi:CheY-like chemotaxis protein